MNAGFTSEPPYFIGGNDYFLQSLSLVLELLVLALIGRWHRPTRHRQHQYPTVGGQRQTEISH